MHTQDIRSASVIAEQQKEAQAYLPSDSQGESDTDSLRFKLVAKLDCDLERDQVCSLSSQILKELQEHLGIDAACLNSTLKNANSQHLCESLDSSTDEPNSTTLGEKEGCERKQSLAQTQISQRTTVLVDFVRKRSFEESVILSIQSVLSKNGFSICEHSGSCSSQSSSSGCSKERSIYFTNASKNPDGEDDISAAKFTLQISEQPKEVDYFQLMLQEFQDSLIGAGIGDNGCYFQPPTAIETVQHSLKTSKFPKFYSIFGSKPAKKTLPETKLEQTQGSDVLNSSNTGSQTASFDGFKVYTKEQGLVPAAAWYGLRAQENQTEMRFNLSSQRRQLHFIPKQHSPALEEPAQLVSIVSTNARLPQKTEVSTACQQEGKQTSQQQKAVKPSGASPVGDRYLKITGIDLKLYPIKEVCNLFNHYGDIEKAFYSESSNSCLYFRYSSPEGAHYTVIQLKNLRLKGMEPKFEMLPATEFDARVLSLQAKGFTPRKRFSAKAGATIPNSINPLSKTLHISFYREGEFSAIEEEALRKQIEKVGVEIVRLKRENKKSNLNMWFLECKSIEDATRVLLKQHNKFFLGGSLRVSFTRNL